MIKWRLLLKTLPWVVCFIAIALLRDYFFRFKGFMEFSEVSPLLPAVALIIGFMLAGVFADYKESEKIPGEIANTFGSAFPSVKGIGGRSSYQKGQVKCLPFRVKMNIPVLRRLLI